MRIALLLFVILSCCTATLAQQQAQPRTMSPVQEKKLRKYLLLRQEEEGDFSYNREFSGGARLNTNGWAGFLEYGWRKNEVVGNFLQFEFSEIKHPKERKEARSFYARDPFTGFPILVSSRPYVYGKINTFFDVRLTYGQRYIIGSKGNKNGVEVSAVYSGGLSLGLLKPYYLELRNDTLSTGTTSTEKYSDSNKDRFLNPALIEAGGGFGKGWNEIRLTPGLHAKLGLRFDWARFNEFLNALEVGVGADYFTQNMQILANTRGERFFFHAYVGYQFGKKWNK